MKTRAIIWISTLLNLALAGAISWKITRPPPALAQAPSVPPPAAVTPAIAEPHPSGMVRADVWPPFLWSQIAAEDLKVYRDNLRAVGCPELTVREIILSEINERFGERRRKLLANLQSRFWEAALRGEIIERPRQAVSPGWKQPLEDLVAERQKVISEVLGNGYPSIDAAEHARVESLEQRYAWLPAEKRAKLIELEAEHARKLAEWAQMAGLRQNSAPDQDEGFQKLQKEYEDAKNQLLTPDEQEELRLRDSSVADWAGSLPGFDPNEDEWRLMTEARAEYEEAQSKLAGTGLSDEEQSNMRGQADAKFQAQLKAALGDERYSEYQLAGNDQYQNVWNVTERYGLPDGVAGQAFEIQQAALASAQQVQDDPTLSPEEQQSRLAAIKQDAERNLGTTLGDKPFSTYMDYNGDWLKGLAAAP